MTDGGGQFYTTVAIQLYDMLGIRKERIDPGEPWQNYAETLFSIQKRLADHAFSNARTWEEIQQAHQTWWKNFNSRNSLFLPLDVRLSDCFVPLLNFYAVHEKT